MALLPGMTETNFLAVATGDSTATGRGRLSYPPETVVKEALAALRARKAPSIVSGPVYRFLTFLSTRLISRKRMIAMIVKGFVILGFL